MQMTCICYQLNITTKVTTLSIVTQVKNMSKYHNPATNFIQGFLY